MTETNTKNSSVSSNGDVSNFLISTKKSAAHARKSRKDLKAVVEFSRKLMYSLNGDSPSNVSFRDNRIYFLGSTRKRDTTIKFIDIVADDAGATSPSTAVDKIIGQPLFEQTFFVSPTNEIRQLTKEEQLLRERKRLSFNGITSFCMDPTLGRLVFSENSDLFYFDDNNSGICEHQISAKGENKFFKNIKNYFIAIFF